MTHPQSTIHPAAMQTINEEAPWNRTDTVLSVAAVLTVIGLMSAALIFYIMFHIC